jgi:hypothetical protein
LALYVTVYVGTEELEPDDDNDELDPEDLEPVLELVPALDDTELDEFPPPEPPPGEAEQPARTANKTEPEKTADAQSFFNP